ncbi:MAG TPA: TetR/AcrR family transcriptional regulator [Candidatus Dormibacteraeota bacterium]
MSRAAVAEELAERELLPPRSVADGTHRRLLEVALLTFSERGFHGVSVRELADAAGIRPSSMYAHLASKEALLMELISMGHEEHRDRLRRAFASEPNDITQRMRALVRAHVRLHAEFPLLGRVANREMHALNPARRERVMKIRQEAQDLLQRTVEEGAAAGVFSVPDPFLAIAVIGGSGIRVAEWWDLGLGYTVEQVEETYADFAIRLLTAGPTPDSPDS